MLVVTIFLLMALQFLTTFEMMLVMPLAPVIAELYGILPVNITLMNLGFAAAGFVSPFFGYLADYFSMKRILQLATLFFGIGSLLVYTNTFVGYIVGRLIIGLGYYNLTSIAMSYTSLIVDNNKLGVVAGVYKIAFALGAFSAPILGTWLQETISFHNIYLILAVSGLVGTFALQVIPDKRIVQEVPLKMNDAFSLVKDRKAQLMIAANVSLNLPTIYFYNYLSVSMAESGINQGTISQFYSIVAFGSILAGVLIALFSDKFGKRRLSILSVAFSGIVLLPFITGSKYILFFGFLFGLGYDTIWGIFYPAGATFYRAKSATFLAILTFTTSVSNVFTNMTAPIIYDIGGFPLLMGICCIGLVVSSFLMKGAFALDNQEQEITIRNH